MPILKSELENIEIPSGENAMQYSKRSILQYLFSAVALYVAMCGALQEGGAQPADGAGDQAAKMAVSASDWSKKYQTSKTV